MSKLPVLNSKEAISLLEKHKFEIIRISGSHYILKRDKTRIVIPFHNKDLHPKIIKEIYQVLENN